MKNSYYQFLYMNKLIVKVQSFQKEKRLVNQLTNGSKAAFKDIFENYWQLLHNIAFNRLHSVEVADDLVQNVFTELWLNRENIKIKKSLKAYLCQCIKHKIYNHIRYQSVRQQKHIAERIYNQYYTHHKDYYSDSEIICKEIEYITDNEIENLPEKTRMMFRLSRVNHYSYEEIAEKFGCSIKNVEYHISKALNKLNIRLKNYNS